jgi:hypothetical protein
MGAIRRGDCVDRSLMQEALSNRAYAGGQREFVPRAAESKRSAISFEIAIVIFAILTLVTAELILSSAIRGTNFAGGDGKMAQAVILVSAVRTVIADRPPPRSVRAGFPHTAPTLGV